MQRQMRQPLYQRASRQTRVTIHVHKSAIQSCVSQEGGIVSALIGTVFIRLPYAILGSVHSTMARL